MKYAIIPNDKRAALLQRVMANQEPIKQVAEQLRIKFPSAKSIIRTFKKEGRVFDKKKTRKTRNSSIQKIQVKLQQKELFQVKQQHSPHTHLVPTQADHLVATQAKSSNPVLTQPCVASEHKFNYPLRLSYNPGYYPMVSPQMYLSYVQYQSLCLHAGFYHE